MELNENGRRLLSAIVNNFPRIQAGRIDTYLGYKQLHDMLGLELIAETYGDSLKAQGLENLALWTVDKELPAITGLIVDKSTGLPGQGYWGLSGTNIEDFAWWEDQIRKSLEFDWSPYISPSSVSLKSHSVSPEREPMTVNRILRDSELAKRVKKMHKGRCQICGDILEINAQQFYAESHHIKPLGNPHNGPDIESNMICVCPNHHVLLDYGTIKIDLVSIIDKDVHYIQEEFVQYHNKLIYNSENS